MTYRIGYIVGSLSSASINRRLAGALVKLAPDTLEFFEVGIAELPLYNRDLDSQYPEVAQRFKREVESADGLLIVSPEYNRSMPGALKNAIDWGSRPWGTNSFARKPTALLGASGGAIGTAVMQASMRNVLSFLNVPQLSSPEAYINFKPDEWDGDMVTNESTRTFLAHYMEEYAAFVERVLASAPGHIGDEG